MQIRDILSRLDDPKKRWLGEVLRFGIVGITATLLQYLVYWGCLRWLSPGLSLTVGYLVSFLYNFYASTHFTFRVSANARRGAGFLLSHGVNYLLQMITLQFFLWLGVGKQWAPLPMFCICVSVNFLLVRYFLKR